MKKAALNSTVLRLGLVSLFADISSEMLYPITPIFLSTVLGASMTSIGLIEGFAEAVSSFLKTYSGHLSDRLHKRKPFIWIGYLLAALAKPLTGLAQGWTHVFAARSLDRVGKGIRTAPRDALLSEAVDESQRGAAFGWHRGMDTLGAVLGPLIALLFLQYFQDNLRWIYFLAVIPGLASVFIVLSLRESQPSEIKIKPSNSVKSSLPRPFKRYLIAWGVFSITNSSDVFLLLRAKSAGASTTQTIFLYCLYNLIYALASPILGKWSDRIGRKKILIGGLLVFAGVYLGFGFAQELWQFAALFAIYGLYTAATDGVGKAFAVDLIPAEIKATGLGLLGTVTGLCAIFSSTAAGVLWDQVSPTSTFIYGAAGALASILLLLTVQERERLNKE